MWFSDITSIVLTRVKAKVNKKLKTKYPDIEFTTSSISSTEPKFPTVYIKRMQGAECGEDLDGSTVNAMVVTFQVEITDNVGDTRSQEVADSVCEVFKSMRFQILGEPFPDNTQKGIYRNIARYQRIIGYGDTL
jgi:hypothetical protein